MQSDPTRRLNGWPKLSTCPSAKWKRACVGWTKRLSKPPNRNSSTNSKRPFADSFATRCALLTDWERCGPSRGHGRFPSAGKAGRINPGSYLLGTGRREHPYYASNFVLLQTILVSGKESAQRLVFFSIISSDCLLETFLGKQGSQTS